ncbi:efflux RND transporter periplasmic adaptor subunit [Telmatocola sphagniphila]|uniref:Efflux RND transporter periplasmic adaptor subunit n=1 Tax=Telmatocola sphagniphila TaxID=1123043 RepID=A0A8E6BB59_9BACT|nr:efflux RND transporter periplasmic adaptor subunit [Telmatocola sphagniphila]QVL34697.1 efflux RND transporter periplasmic adaptor subunit [Telmatocola sphagniphila]
MLRRIFPLALCILIGCGNPPQAPQPPEPPVVTVEKVIERELDSNLDFTGYLKAPEDPEIRAQVTGYLKEIAFTNGELVKENQILYQIDPEPYEAAMLNAKANVEKAKADVITADSTLTRATLDYDRAAKLRDTKSLSVEEFDTRRAAKDAAVAGVSAAKAAQLAAEASLKKAQFDRDNCTIRNPVKGISRISQTYITKGALVTAGSSVLCKVVSLNPIRAYFDVDEMTSLLYRRQIYDTKELADPSNKNQLDCWVAMKDETETPDGKYPHPGKLVYVAPEVTRGTATIEVYAEIQNGEPYRLRPGDSVRIKVVAGKSKKYITIPEIAVGSQQQQKFVYVVTKDKEGKDIAEFRPVILGAVRQVGNLRLQIVEKGLNLGETIIVNGLLRVRPGAEIKPKEMPLASK